VIAIFVGGTQAFCIVVHSTLMKSSIVSMENPRSVAALERELVKEYLGVVLTIVFR